MYRNIKNLTVFLLYTVYDWGGGKSNLKQLNVVVVGGGLAGLVVAALLSKRKINILLLEKFSEIGGDLKDDEIGMKNDTYKFLQHLKFIDIHGVKSTKDLVSTLSEYIESHGVEIIRGVQVDKLVRHNLHADWLVRTTFHNFCTSSVVLAVKKSTAANILGSAANPNLTKINNWNISKLLTDSPKARSKGLYIINEYDRLDHINYVIDSVKAAKKVSKEVISDRK